MRQLSHFSLLMDLREKTFLEKLVSKLHARNRVFYSFGFCLMFSLLLFYFLILINTNTPTTSLSHHITLTKSLLANQSGRDVEMKETQEGNLSRSGLIGKDLEKAHERSLTKGGVVESCSGKELEKAHERNLSISNWVESGRGKEVEKAHERNLSMSGVNRSYSGKELEKANEKNFCVSSGGKELEKAHGRNLSISGLVGNSSGKELEKMHENNTSLSGLLKNSNEKATRIFRKCDIFNGRWVSDEGVPHYYPPGSCPYIDNDFNCHRNHRPDDKFLKWRWQPKGCNIPRLDPVDFLRRLRGKRLIFVGDSLNRNMWESLVCILRHSVPNKRRVYETSGRNQFKARGYYSVKFKGYNCSVDFVHSPFLVRETRGIGVTGKVDEKLRLDLMEETTSTYLEADIVVFNTGHWWTHEKTSSGIDYYQEGNHVYPVLEPSKAYEKALTTWALWMDNNINANRTRVLFRGYSPTHFSGGRWNSGGQCDKETEPIFNDKFLDEYPSKMRTLQRVLQKMKTPVIYLNITRLTDYRKDGHPSIYRRTYNMIKDPIVAEKYQDCSHWCLPGIPDTWNELLYASMLIDGKGSWRNRLSHRGWFSTAKS